MKPLYLKPNFLVLGQSNMASADLRICNLPQVRVMCWLLGVFQLQVATKQRLLSSLGLLEVSLCTPGSSAIVGSFVRAAEDCLYIRGPNLSPSKAPSKTCSSLILVSTFRKMPKFYSTCVGDQFHGCLF